MLCLITSNIGKIREIAHLLPGIEIVQMSLPEVQALEAAEVVRQKALLAFKKLNCPVLVEDTGLYIHAWNGFPGALIKWLLQSVGVDGIWRMLANFDDKTAHAQTVVGLHDGKEIRFFEGRVDGQIVAPRGQGDFGWDAIFQPHGYEMTFAEMSLEQKNAISMRHLAFEKVKNYLTQNPLH